MPEYAFACQACRHAVVQILCIGELARVRCPACGSEDVVRQRTAFHAKTSKNS